MSIKTIYHLSHTDLDGYSAQLVMKHSPHNMTYFNANYGAEVKVRLEEILETVKANKAPATILVTDLNLNTEEARWINLEVKRLNENALHVELLLLDHHGSGKDSAIKYEWYNLDTTRCATKIMYDYAVENFEVEETKSLSAYVDVVNAVDLWLQDETKNFEYGKVCMKLVSDARELSRVMFASYDREYKFALLSVASSMMDVENANIILDEKMHSLKKDFFRYESDNTIDNLVTHYIVGLFGKYKADMTIYYKGYKGFLSYAVGNTSIIGNGFLVTYDDYDFIMDVSPRGTISIRANNKVDVSLIAKEIANGGGHPNASGGRIQGFKEQFIYSKVKAQIVKLLESKESVERDLDIKS